MLVRQYPTERWLSSWQGWRQTRNMAQATAARPLRPRAGKSLTGMILIRTHFPPCRKHVRRAIRDGTIIGSGTPSP